MAQDSKPDSSPPPPAPTADRDTAWRSFEKQVALLFRLKGFNTTADTSLAGRQTDLLLEASDGDEAIGPILVECKYHDPSHATRVTVEDVEAFAARALRLRNSGDISHAYLVTNTGFSAQARGTLGGRPEAKFVFLRTTSDLLRRLVNLEGYLRRFVQDYEQEAILHNYEPLSLQRWDLRTPITARHPAAREPSHDAVAAFVQEDQRRFLLLAGDYGTGKTSLCRRVCYDLAREALKEGSSARLPVYLALKHYSSATTSAGLIQTFLTKEGVSRTTIDAFLEMNSGGLLILLLDGFDEMAKRVTAYTRRESFSQLTSLSGPRSKVLVAGRPGYFPTDAELLECLDLLGFSDLPPSPARKKREKRERDSWIAYQLAAMESAQVRSFLLRRAVHRDAEAADDVVRRMMAWIDRTYNLRDLASRPILLEMIADSLEGEARKRKIRNAGDLYSEYVDKWLRIDASKGEFRSLLSREQRLVFSLALAWALFVSGQSEVHYKRLQEYVREYFQLVEIEDVDHFSSDVRTCSFLVRDDEGNYRFAHQSFMEYFVARLFLGLDSSVEEVVGRFGDLDVEVERLSHLQEASPEVLVFMGNLIGCRLDSDFWTNVEDALAQTRPGLLKDEMRGWIVELARGSPTVAELREAVTEIKRLYKRLVEISKGRPRRGEEHGLADLALLLHSETYVGRPIS